jgi:hypothetical protein
MVMAPMIPPVMSSGYTLTRMTVTLNKVLISKRVNVTIAVLTTIKLLLRVILRMRADGTKKLPIAMRNFTTTQTKTGLKTLVNFIPKVFVMKIVRITILNPIVKKSRLVYLRILTTIRKGRQIRGGTHPLRIDCGTAILPRKPILLVKNEACFIKAVHSVRPRQISLVFIVHWINYQRFNAPLTLTHNISMRIA